eukprot:3893730-Prymnesium_polylepis.2
MGATPQGTFETDPFSDMLQAALKKAKLKAGAATERLRPIVRTRKTLGLCCSHTTHTVAVYRASQTILRRQQ